MLIIYNSKKHDTEVYVYTHIHTHAHTYSQVKNKNISTEKLLQGNITTYY